MPENEFGLMKLLEKLVAERGGGAEVKGDELRDLKETLGAQFTEAEAHAQGLLDDSWIKEPMTKKMMEQQRYLKETLGSQGTEKEINAFIQNQATEADRAAIEFIDQAFGKAMSSIPDWQQSDIIQAVQGMTPRQLHKFKKDYILGNIPSYQLENMQPPEANLGFGGDQLAQGSQFYNYDLGIFMPSSYQGGHTGRTGDERFQQGTAGWGFDSYPHSKSRNVYNEKMMNPRYFPLKLG